VIGKEIMDQKYRPIVVSTIAVLLFLINIPAKIFAANGTIKAKEIHQTMIGFGASIAWADDQLTTHPNKGEIYNYLFNDLGLDILRIRNIYRNNPANFVTTFVEIVDTMYALSPQKPKILLSSWSPPADIKSNNDVQNGGTLIKQNGKYVYGAFAQYWVDAINAYRSSGIDPDYITIQNEPDFDATWESCHFDATETLTNAGYNRALDTVYNALQQLQSPPKILGPEVLGIGYGEFQKYGQSFNRNHLDGYAYHLYHGESDNVSDNHNPDLFIPNLSTIANTYQGKPIFQTEYDRGDWFNTVWLMHNCLVYGNVSAYLWWELVWGATGGNPLVAIEDPNYPSSWTTPHGYSLSTTYWAIRQYSKFISSDWERVTADVDTSILRVSAFISPVGNKLTVVVLNIKSLTQSMNFDIQDFSVDSGMVIRTSANESGDTIRTSYDGKSTLDFPARSITTLSFSGALVTTVDNKPIRPIEFSLSQNYPNPFNPSTTIDYSLAKESFVQLKIFDVLGREIKTLIDEKETIGKHTVHFDASDLNSGIYFYRITAGGFSQSQKMILVK
jgi:glucuronoarabinoxylan endo-1,4-beta-xylanase